MKRLIGIAATLAALSLVLSPRGVGAAPPTPCPNAPIVLDLEPLDAFVDGGQVSRGSNGRFTNDAGFEFDVESERIEPIAGVLVNSCMQPSTKLRISVIDPFTGAAHELEMEVAP